MPIPMQRCGASRPKNRFDPPPAAAPSPTKAPAAPAAPAASAPTEQYPLSSVSPKTGTLWEGERYKQILSALQDESVTVITVDVAKEDMPTVQGQLAAIYNIGHKPVAEGAEKRVTFNLPVPADVEENDFRLCQFGLPVADMEEIERLTIGNFPMNLVRLAWWSLKLGRGIDLLSPELGLTAERIEEMGDETPESLNLIDNALAKHVLEYLARAPRKIKFVGVTPSAIPGCQVSDQDFAKLPGIPINFWDVLDLYKQYLGSNQEIVEYAREIALSLFMRKPVGVRTPAALEGVLRKIRPTEEEPRTIPLDYNLLRGGRQEAVWGLAREKFFLGKKAAGDETEVVIIDLTSMPSELFFVDSSKGIVRPQAGELLARIKNVGQISMGTKKKKKVILLTNSALKTTGPGGKEDDIQGIGKVEIPSPVMEEIKGSLVPTWIVRSFAARRAAGAAKTEGAREPLGHYRGMRKDASGKPVEVVMVETKLEPQMEPKTGRPNPKAGREKTVKNGTEVACYLTNDGERLAAEMSRYLNGFSLSGIDEYVARSLRLAGAAAAPGQVGVQAGAIDLDRMLEIMQERYTETLFKISGGETGSQLTEVFKVVDATKWASKGMKHPARIKEVLRNIKAVRDVESLFEGKESRELESLKVAVKRLGIDPERDLNIPNSRYQMDEQGYILDANGEKIPRPAIDPNQLVWDELRQENIQAVREEVKRFLPESQVLSMQVSGPPGMGKTSNAKSIAAALGYMFVEWTICATKNKYVGETGKNVRAMFNFVERLQDTVLLLDEVDKCLSKKDNTGIVDPVQGDIVEEFQKRFPHLVNDVAPRNHLFIIATTNFPFNLPEAITRRLKEPYEMDYLRTKEEIDELVEGVFSRWEDSTGKIISRPPSGEEVAAGADPNKPLLRQKYADALFKEAQPMQMGGKDAPYSNDEMGELLKYWINWNRTTASQINKKYMRQYKKDFMWDPMTLVYMVQKSSRQSQAAKGHKEKAPGLIPAYPPLNLILSGGKAVDVGQVAPTYGREVTPKAPGTGIQTQPTPPKANEVNVPQVRSEAEEGVIAPVGRTAPRQAAKTASSVKLLSIADNASDQSQGLKYISHLPPLTGMLFKFQSPRVLNFWMQDTYVPLDIAFIDDSGRIVKTEHMIPMSLRTVSSGSPCVMALETSAGTLERLDVKIGKKVLVDYDTKMVTFDD